MRAANLSRLLLLLAALALAQLTSLPAARAENLRPIDRTGGPDHDAARDGVREGKLISLAEAKRIVLARYPGEYLDAKLYEFVPGQPVYRVLVLMKDDRRIAVWVDAKTGQIMRVEG